MDVLLNKVYSLIAIGFVGFIGWLAWKAFRSTMKKSDDPVKLLVKWGGTFALIITWAFIMKVLLKMGGIALIFGVLLTATFGVLIGIMWAPSWGRMLASPLSSMYDGGSEQAEPTPFYAIAEAKRKRGLYDASIAEVRKQLARFPSDTQGHLMLAEMLAEHRDDFEGAVALLNQFVSEHEPGPVNGSFVLNRLADLYLKYRQDPAGARQSLQRLQSEFPDTEQADKAAQRIAHLQDEDFLTTRQAPKKMEVRKMNLKLGLSGDASSMQVPEVDVDAKARNMVEHLETHPRDTEVREQLAWIYAEHYGKIDWAIDQLKQLTQMEHQSVSKLARWYNQTADIYCRFSGSAEAAKLSLEEFIGRFPDSGHSERARHRLKRLNLEVRTSKKGRSDGTDLSTQKTDST
ncbi:MAG: tetratricopeptide repeat protein [Verrucomicrobiota bacterium]|nr:tetratricopeptide repeat protein [Verrucomicrobiota bacterium]